MVGARVRRQQVAYAQGRGLSGRRACALLSVARSSLGYVSRLIARDPPVLPAMRTLAGQYPRYGYRTIRIFLDRQGHVMIVTQGRVSCPRPARASYSVDIQVEGPSIIYEVVGDASTALGEGILPPGLVASGKRR
jgi:hypothetical protein